MLRYEANPTRDMHIGDLRIALLNYIVSSQRGESFIVKFKDIDTENVIEGKDNEILDILALFGIQYTQVIHQSQNIRFHSAMALQLLHEKRAFSCFCSSAWLEKKQQEAIEAKKDYCYDDACRDLPAELVIDNTNPFTVRIKRPDQELVIEDKIKGKLHFTPDSVDSFVIMNQDKTPTLDFACAVDDMLSDISMIIAYETDINKSSKQQHVRDSLDYNKKIEYAHLPLVLGEDSVMVKDLLADGYLPSAILNYLVSSVTDGTSDIFTIEDAIRDFDISSILNTPINFSMETLQKINKRDLRNLDPKELSRYVGFADEEIGRLASIYLDEVHTTQELKRKIKSIFAHRDIPHSLEKQVKTIKSVLKKAPYFDQYQDFKEYLLQETALQEEELIKSLRLLLTNAEDDVSLSKVYQYLKNYLGEIIK
jgi:glutamyl-tRNA synthetase